MSTILSSLFPFLTFSHYVSVIIKGMAKKGMCGVAIEAAQSFGVEEQFPPETILTSFLRESQEEWESARKRSQKSPLNLVCFLRPQELLY